MPAQDTSIIKERIINFLKLNGPSLPVHISREIKMDSLFASAFLSELFSQNRLKITNMKVGGSPLYYIIGTEDKLEKYAEEFLKSKEKEAFLLLKEKKYLLDSEQEPAIRVALRAIKDFAKPMDDEGKLIWQYYLVKEEIPKEEKIINPNIPNSIFTEVKKTLEKQDKSLEKEQEKPLEEIVEKVVIEEKKEIPKKVKEKTRPKKKITTTEKQKSPKNQKNERFFNLVKENLQKKEFEILDIISFSKESLILKIKKEKEIILIAYNKKKITETDIVNAYKKAQEFALEYTIFALGEPAKKTTNLIESIKNLISIEIIE